MKNSLKANKNLILEIIAVISGAAYTLLISYGIIWCWLFAIISSVTFIYLCFSKRLLAETILHAFYLVMGVYGYFTWGADGELTVETLGWINNLWIIALGTALCLGIGTMLKKTSKAALPYIDTFTTVFSFIATFMMIEMILENWMYWIVIDAVSVYLYSKRGLHLSALLYLAYVGLAINGWYQWV